MGASYYEDLFKNFSGNCNLPYDNVFISRFTLLDKVHYVEHNEVLSDEEISIINVLFSELRVLWQKNEDEIQGWLDSLKRD